MKINPTEEVTTLEELVKSLKQTKSSLEENIRVREIEHTNLRNDIGSIRYTVSELIKEKNELESNVKNFSAQLEKIKAEVEQYTADRDALRESKVSIEASIKSQVDTHNAMVDEINVAAAELASREKAYGEAVAKLVEDKQFFEEEKANHSARVEKLLAALK